MDKKAQNGIIAYFILIMLFVVCWFIFLGDYVRQAGEFAVETNNLVGLEAFFYSNLNVFIMVILVLGVTGYMYFGANQ